MYKTLLKLLDHAFGLAYQKPFLSAIAGGLASGAVGKLLGGGGGSSTSQSQSTSAQPFTSGGGLFNVSFGQRPRQTGGRSQNNRGGGGGGAIPPGSVQLADGRVVPASSRAAQREPHASQGGLQAPGVGGGQSGTRGQHLNMSIADPRLSQMNNLALRNANLFGKRARNDPFAKQAGQLGQDFLGQLGETDPMAIAQSQFDLLNPLIQQQQEQDFLGLESRLFSQGQLGGGGFSAGQNQLNSLFDAQADQETKLLFDSLNQGLSTQSHLFNLGSGLSGLEMGRRQGFGNLSNSFLQMPLAIQQAMLSQAQVAGGLSGANTVGSLSQPGLNMGQTIGAGFLNQGAQQLTGAANDFFGGFGGNTSPTTFAQQDLGSF